MNQNNTLLEQKVRDYYKNIFIYPQGKGKLHNMFSKIIGISAATMLENYELIHELIEQGQNKENIKSSVDKNLMKKSKIKIPTTEKSTRICGLVAIKYSGFFDTEIEIYNQIIKDNGSSKITDSQLESILNKNPEKYNNLLKQKAEAVQKFELLMGFKEDTEKYEQITKELPDKTKKYFDKITGMHTGKKLGFSWPIPLKKFSKPLKESLYNDDLMYKMQKILKKDCGFKKPAEKNLDLLVDEARTFLDTIKNTDISITDRIKSSYKIPTSIYILSGMNVYAQNNEAAQATPGPYVIGTGAAISLIGLKYLTQKVGMYDDTNFTGFYLLMSGITTTSWGISLQSN